MSDFNELLFSFTEHMKVKNYSPSSIVRLPRATPGLLHLSQGTSGHEDVKRVTRDHLQGYQLVDHGAPSGDKGYSAGTLCTKTRAVKRFFEYLEDSGVILINPAEQIKEPKKETRLPRTS